MSINPFTRENIVTIEDPKAASRLIARARKTGESALVEAGYATYAAVRSGMSRKEIGELFGDVKPKSTAWVTLCNRLGTYLVKGGEPGTQTWKVLAHSARANNAEVAAVIMDEESTVADVDAKVASLFMPDGKPTAAKEAKVTPAEGEVPVLDQAMALVKALRLLTDGFDAEAWATVESALNTVISRKVRALAKVEAAA